MAAVSDEVFLSQWPYETDFNDHFETPKVAYEDVLPLLTFAATERFAAKKDKKSKEEFLKDSMQQVRLYDPYYCEGSMVEMMSSLGFEKMINRKKDFYEDWTNNHIPKHDLLITNPPYSGEHKVWLLEFIMSRWTNSGKPLPFLILLPSWSAAKKYWRDFLVQLREPLGVTGDPSAENEIEKDVGAFYMVPSSVYEFRHPIGAGKDVAPFKGIWFGAGFPQDKLEYLAKKIEKAQAASGRSGKLMFSLKELEENDLTRSPEAVATRLKTNPKQAALRDEALSKRDQYKKEIQATYGKKKRVCPTNRKRAFAPVVEDDKPVKKAKTENVCRHFLGKSGCTRGDQCRFSHDV